MVSYCAEAKTTNFLTTNSINWSKINTTTLASLIFHIISLYLVQIPHSTCYLFIRGTLWCHFGNYLRFLLLLKLKSYCLGYLECIRLPNHSCMPRPSYLQVSNGSVPLGVSYLYVLLFDMFHFLYLLFVFLIILYFLLLYI